MKMKKMIRIYVVMFICLLFSVIPGFAADTSDKSNKPDILDSFKREKNNGVGRTETGDYLWVEVGDNTNGDLIYVDDGLKFHYFLSEPKNADLACNLAEFKAKNVDISFTMYPYYKYGNCSGVSYRLNSLNSTFASPGYHVIINSLDDPNTISLKFGGVTVIKKQELVISSPSKIRVIANGDSHKVYLNGGLVIDVKDSGETEDGYVKTDEGYVGFFAYYDLPTFKDFSLTVIPEMKQPEK
ncbi:MAG: hypothetical protein Q7J15_04115 [Candidatus Desulfaltia sp.]|nr:hypothetical protein [Candidatus Desulfaltia sp.]